MFTETQKEETSNNRKRNNQPFHPNRCLEMLFLHSLDLWTFQTTFWPGARFHMLKIKSCLRLQIRSLAADNAKLGLSESFQPPWSHTCFPVPINAVMIRTLVLTTALKGLYKIVRSIIPNVKCPYLSAVCRRVQGISYCSLLSSSQPVISKLPRKNSKIFQYELGLDNMKEKEKRFISKYYMNLLKTKQKFKVCVFLHAFSEYLLPL